MTEERSLGPPCQGMKCFLNRRKQRKQRNWDGSKGRERLDGKNGATTDDPDGADEKEVLPTKHAKHAKNDLGENPNDKSGNHKLRNPDRGFSRAGTVLNRKLRQWRN